MRHETLDGAALSYAPCRYGTSRILFRGPRRPLSGRYVAFVGGSGTYGKYVRNPFPALIERRLAEVCVNFGCANGGLDTFARDNTILAACHDATATVVQVMGAHTLSNRFYTVHPRRNDRFLRASSMLQALYHDVDFSQYCFTGHLLRDLYALSPQRFEVLRVELQTAWVARMQRFLEEIGPNCVLLWLAESPPDNANWDARPDPLQADPLFVTLRMVETLRPMVRDIVVATASPEARAYGTLGMAFAPVDEGVASALPGVIAHQDAAAALLEALSPMMEGPVDDTDHYPR